MPEPKSEKPESNEAKSGSKPGDYLYGTFSDGDDEVLVPVSPGQAPRIPDKVPDRMSSRRLWLMVFIIIVVAVVAYFSYQALDNWRQESLEQPATEIDSDGDGLSDAEESSQGTNPQQVDTDGDGFTDSQEINSGYDPLTPAQ